LLVVTAASDKGQDLLLRPAEGEVVPGTAMTLSIAAVVGELDALADRARSHGGGQGEGPADTSWNTRDLLAWRRLTHSHIGI
jgi:hypothetical protein